MAVEAIERDLGRQLGGGRQLEVAFRRDAHVRLEPVELLLLQSLDPVSRALAVELGPDRVVGAAEKSRIGASPRHFAHAPRAEWEGQGDVGGNVAMLHRSTREVIDDAANVRPVPGVARVQFHWNVNRRHAGGRISHAVNRIRVRDRAQHRDAVHLAGQVRQ